MDAPSAPTRIALLIHSLDGGGAERTVAQMANWWAARGHDVTVVTLESPQHDRYPLTDQVRRIGLAMMEDSHSVWTAAYNNFRRVRKLRQVLRQLDCQCVISFTEQMNVLALLACRGRFQPLAGCRVIVAERTDPRLHHVGRIWRLLRRRVYRRADAIVVQTPPIQQFVEQFAGQVPVHVIPNCVWPESIPAELPRSSDRRRQLVAVGRLSPEKGFDQLLAAFAQIAAEFPDWQLKIVGEGPQRTALEQQLAAAGMQQQVELVGWHPRPSELLLSSQLFVLPSRYEGFPNALLEAMACGTAAISFDCESGPREIIRHEVDGLLVPPGDCAALADAMRRVLSNDAEREQLARRASEVTERFAAEACFARWQAVCQIE